MELVEPSVYSLHCQFNSEENSKKKMFTKSLIVFCIVCLLTVNCLPAPEEESSAGKNIRIAIKFLFDFKVTQWFIVHYRAKRATCDLLSLSIAGVQLNDSACAAHCIGLGRRGGYCNGKKVCVCRKWFYIEGWTCLNYI